jgi:hypothetical protein
MVDRVLSAVLIGRKLSHGVRASKFVSTETVLEGLSLLDRICSDLDGNVEVYSKYESYSCGISLDLCFLRSWIVVHVLLHYTAKPCPKATMTSSDKKVMLPRHRPNE